MQSKEVTIRLQALDGVWEVGGRDRKRGIMPENVSLTSDLWGPATASFDLRRDPRSTWPDLGAYTPVEVEVGGKVVWAGRVQQTPTSISASDRVISVQAQGWQYHLDDDLYEKVYVHSKLSDWRDARTFPNADLTKWLAAPQVAQDQGVSAITYAKGQVITALSYAGLILDLGPYSTAASISLDWESSNNLASMQLFARAASSVATVLSAANDAVSGLVNTTGASGSARGTFPTPGRYVAIFAWMFNGADYTPTADNYFRITGARVFTTDSWRSTDASILKASDVITDALSQAQALLSTDRSGVAATSFAIPDFAMSGPQSPREVWSAVNAYHDYIAQVDVQKRPVFKAKPTAPMYEVGAWSPLELEDQSANSGDEIYNRVIVTGTQPDGTALRVSRFASEQSGVTLLAITTPSPANPSFTTDASSWTNATRDTVTFRSTPASGAVASGATATETFTGAFSAGSAYRIRGFIFQTTGGTKTATVVFGTTTKVVVVPTSAWVQFEVDWVAAGASPSATLQVSLSSGAFNIDDLALFSAAPTLVDRRRFIRTKELPVSGALTVAAAQQIADLWLAAHKTTPYKGSFKLTGDRAIRDPANGTPIKLETLLLHTGELIRDTAAIDPDTGGIGRDGRIAAVTYTPATEEATVTLDNSRASFESLMARLDLINGVGK